MSTQPPPDLQQLRETIEGLDRELIDLFKRRMAVAEHVAAAKIEAAYPFRDQLREDQILIRVRKMAAEQGLDPHQMESLFRRIFQMAISHQQNFLQSLDRAPLRVAYQGVEGSFSHLTAQRRYRGRKGGTLLTGFDSFRGAAESVRQGENDLALLPIENSTAGSINETYDLLAEEGLIINAEEISRISHCLLVLPGTSIKDIGTVISHPQALRQCEDYLHSLPWITIREEFDTAGSARKVKEGNDPKIAAIASASAGRVYGLEVAAADIQTQSGNFTRFVEVGTEASTCPPDLPCRTSLILATGHHPGDLADVLRHFSSRNINMTKLESRPVPDRPFQYRFYLDVDGHAESQALAEALEAIQPHTRELRILGTYPAAERSAEALEASQDVEL